MALDSVQLILEGLRQHSARQFANRQLAQESEIANKRQESLDKDREARVKQEQEDFKERQRQFDLINKAGEAFRKVQQAREYQQIGIEGAKTGILPPGMNTSSASSSIPGGQPNFTPVNPQQATSQNVTFPSGESMNIPMPNVMAQREADYTRIAGRPEVEARIEQSRALQADLLKKQDEAKQADFERMMYQKILDDARNNATNKAANERAELAANTQLAVARIQTSSRQPVLPEDFNTSVYTDALYNGDKTVKDVMAEFPTSKQIPTAIISSFTAAGHRALSDQQKQTLANYGSFAGIINEMDEFLDISPQVDAGGLLKATGAGITGVYNSLAKTPASLKQSELESKAAEVAKNIQGQKGALSDRDIAIAAKGSIPGIGKGYNNNKKLRDDFYKLVNVKFDSDFHNIPLIQRDALRKKIGLLDISPKYTIKNQPLKNQPQVDPKVQAELDRLGIK